MTNSQLTLDSLVTALERGDVYLEDLDPDHVERLRLLLKRHATSRVGVDEESRSSFGQYIRHLRTKKGLTLRELAKELRITHAYLSHVETNLTKPSEDVARRLAQFFGADEEEVIFFARDIPRQIQEIKEKYPHVAPAYFMCQTKKAQSC